jgi:hypothetical protein
MKLTWGKVCGGVLVVALLVGWQDAAPSPDSHDAAARELMASLDLKNLTTQAFDTMIDAQVQANPAMASCKDILLDWGHKYMTWEAMEPQIIKLYTDAFTEPELREMTAFYRTPTGAKAARAIPDLFQKGAQIGLTIANEHKDELQKALMEKLTKGDGH